VTRKAGAGGRIEALEDLTSRALAAGLVVSTLLLLAGLLGAPGALQWGILLLMLTPVLRVLLVTIGLALERDWVFTLVSLFVLAVLFSGAWLGTRAP
jgi:uncharacterized membrane protein